MKKHHRYSALLALLLAASLLPACGKDGMTVMDPSGNSVKITAADKDTYTFKLSASQEKLPEQPQESRNNSFIDIAKGAWYYEPILNCYENGLMRGTSQNTFSPDAPTNRAMIVSTLWRLENTPSAPESTFADVPVDEYYSKAVAWASANNIVGGYDSQRFGPNDPVTREQLAAILYRYAVYKGYDVSQTASLETFADAGDISAYAEPALSWAAAEGIIHGMENQALLPRGNATRAQMAVILNGLQLSN